jgi:hypothetical protein
MPSSSPELILFLVFLILVAVALDVALIRAWRRYRKTEQKKQAVGSKPAAGRHFPLSLFHRAASDKKLGAAAIPLRGKKPTIAPIVLQGASTKGKGRVGSKLSAGSPVPDAGRASAKAELEEGSPDEIVIRKTKGAAGGRPGKTARVQVSVDLPPGESVRFTIESVGTGKTPPGVRTERWISSPAGRPTARFPGPATGVFAETFFQRLQAGIQTTFSSFWASARTSGRSLFFLALHPLADLLFHR